MRVGPGREVDHVAMRGNQPAGWRVAKFLGEPAVPRILVRQDRRIGVEDCPAAGRRLHGANVLDALVEGKVRQGQVTNTFAGRVKLPFARGAQDGPVFGLLRRAANGTREILDRKGGPRRIRDVVEIPPGPMR